MVTRLESQQVRHFQRAGLGLVGWLLAIWCATGAALVQAGTPSAADIKLLQVIDPATIKGELTALRDHGSNTTVLVYREGIERPRVFAGNGRLFFEQVTLGFYGDATEMETPMVAPRARPKGRTFLKFFKGNFTFSCGDKDIVALAYLTSVETSKVLADATFYSSGWVRRSEVLARDAAGIYYFVDRLRDELGGSGFRVFVGKRGKLKQLPLLDVADDAAGMVFETKSGEIRLTVDKNQERTITWNVKGKAKKLTWLDAQFASYLIYRELGIYAGFGTLCDDR